jgi:hypothetical protein
VSAESARAPSYSGEYEQRFVEELGGPFGWTVPFDPFDPKPFEGEMKAMRRRTEFVYEYAWAIPTKAALDVLEQLAPIVEVGAGGGYWAMLLRGRGVDVVAYDARPGPVASATEFVDHTRRSWSEVLEGDAAAAGDHPDRTLFLCWPPYDDNMGHHALKAYLDAGGKTLVHVGEDYGCTANEAFFTLLDERMREDEGLQRGIPQWPGVHDYLSVHRAK